MASLPLSGRRILVTRTAHQAGELCKGLRALGAVPVEVPVLEICPPEDCVPLDAAMQHLNEYDWLILTSANTVRALVKRASILGTSLVQPASLRVVAVGKSTADAAQKAGFTVAFIPENYVGESLVDGIVSRAAYQRILLVRAAVARDVIPDALHRAGADVHVIDAYRNVLPEAAPEQLRQALAAGIDAATFTSSSSVTHLAEAARTARIPFPLAGVPAVSIGPITSQTLRKLGWEPANEANPFDILGLIEATVAHFASTLRSD